MPEHVTHVSWYLLVARCNRHIIANVQEFGRVIVELRTRLRIDVCPHAAELGVQRVVQSGLFGVAKIEKAIILSELRISHVFAATLSKI